MTARKEQASPGQRTGQTPGTGQMSSFKPGPSSGPFRRPGPVQCLIRSLPTARSLHSPPRPVRCSHRRPMPGIVTVQTSKSDQMSSQRPVPGTMTVQTAVPGPAPDQKSHVRSEACCQSVDVQYLCSMLEAVGPAIEVPSTMKIHDSGIF